MAKKSRKNRVSISSKPVAVKQNQNNGNIVQSAKSKNGNGPTVATTVISNERYAYVTKDLITIGVIAGALILVLVILTFILR